MSSKAMVGVEESKTVDSKGNSNIGEFKLEKSKSLNNIARVKSDQKSNSLFISRSRLSRLLLCRLGAIAMLVLSAYMLELSTLREVMRSRVFMLRSSSLNINDPLQSAHFYDNNGFLTISANGGLNQMRAGICDMVAIARYLNVTLIIPELDETSFWHDRSGFQDIFDVDYFIKSLRDQVRILKEIPDEQKKNAEIAKLYPISPTRWSTISYYNKILPQIKKNQVLHFNQTDFRLANNHLPLELQQFRCRVNFKALRFVRPLEELGRKIVRLLREKGPFLALHLRYEKDMLAFSGCTEGCNNNEIVELTKMRFAYPWWKQKLINSVKRRKDGACPLTPEETALALRAMDIDPSTQIYIAAGDIYGGERRMTPLRLAFPHFVNKKSLLDHSELGPFWNHSNQMAALDYIVSMESDIFVPTYKGNMARLVEGHRRYMGFKTTILLDRKLIVNLTDEYKNGSLSWDEFSKAVKTGHTDRMGAPTSRKMAKYPMLEDYFYANPQECLPSPPKISNPA
ncbi:rhamnogalacturonan I rhamnosyltransferase 1 isoform X2 [Ziziphus jujuba]|uniref:O-fucosyltransferase family protein n=1 Tax=Ziziphus jujuba TaxID=326968 RepID=A0ABM3I1W3_ZIZJJ|nr:rhamnogalacturonan I rhamnosyltransferase 1 isoform X2 [Ziziphus jujuba]